MAKVRQCQECKHSESFWIEPDLSCTLGHKIRFFKPNNDNPYDTSWGWKRRCDDFEQRIDGNLDNSLK